MSRYNDIERLGVIETDKIVTKYIGWIFREQPIVDVGLDAIIEQSEEGIPTGKFVAVQIKSGEGNFHISEKSLIYYVSNIHYYYWLNLSIPIILVAHLPKTEKTYWQCISKRNLKKTRKKWKLEIPRKQEFNKKSKERLTKILSNKTEKSFILDLYKGKIESDTLFDFAENTECISESIDTVSRIVDVIYELGEKANKFTSKLTNFIDNGLSDKDPQVRASYKGYGRDLIVISKRLENEVKIFSELYSLGFYAYEKVVQYHYLITKDSKNLKLAIQSLNSIPDSVDEALSGINEMRIGVSKLPKKHSVLKEGKVLLIEVIDMLIYEFTESKNMAKKIIRNIELEK